MTEIRRELKNEIGAFFLLAVMLLYVISATIGRRSGYDLPNFSAKERFICGTTQRVSII